MPDQMAVATHSMPWRAHTGHPKGPDAGSQPAQPPVPGTIHRTTLAGHLSPDRAREPTARPLRRSSCGTRRILLKLSEREYETIAAAAAEHGGLTPTGFAAEAALATARGVAMAGDAAALAGDDEGLRQVLVELMQARTQLRAATA